MKRNYFLFFLLTLFISCQKLEEGIEIQNDFKQIVLNNDLIEIDKKYINSIRNNNLKEINDIILSPATFEFKENKMIMINILSKGAFFHEIKNYRIQRIGKKYIINGYEDMLNQFNKEIKLIFDFHDDTCNFSGNIWGKNEQEVLYVDKGKNICNKIQNARKKYYSELLKDYNKEGFDFINNNLKLNNYFIEYVSEDNYCIYNVEDSISRKTLNNYFVIHLFNKSINDPIFNIEIDEKNKRAFITNKNIHYVPGGYWLEE